MARVLTNRLIARFLNLVMNFRLGLLLVLQRMGMLKRWCLVLVGLVVVMLVSLCWIIVRILVRSVVMGLNLIRYELHAGTRSEMLVLELRMFS